MKRINLYLLVLLMAITPVLQSCDDDGYSLGNFAVKMATVRTIGGDSYTLELDNGMSLWVGASQIPWYEPVDGQRVWADFTLLSDKYNEYDHIVRVNYLWNVLTKQVEMLTEENEDEYGDSPVYIEDMWIGGNNLNVQFVFPIPNKGSHKVSLVQNTTMEYPEDGYAHLEYRYTEAENSSDYGRRSYVSFHLGEFGPQRETENYIKGIKVRINSSANGEKEIVFDYNSSQDTEEQQFDNDAVNDGVK